MKIINVIVVEKNVVNSIDSFILGDDDVINDVVKKAEDHFVSKCLEYGGNEDVIDACIEDGVYITPYDIGINLVWS